MNPTLRDLIVSWLVQNSYTKSSFERIVANVPGANSYDQLTDLVRAYPDTFRNANMKGGLPGLALIEGFRPAGTTNEEVELTNEDVRVAPLETDLPKQGDVVVVDGEVKAIESPVGECSAPSPGVAYDVVMTTPTPDLTPIQAVKALFHAAGTAHVSGSAKNFAEAAITLVSAIDIARRTNIDLN